MFDLDARGRVTKEYTKRILKKLGKTDRENIEKDLIIDYLNDRGADENRKILQAIELTESEDQSLDRRSDSFAQDPLSKSIPLLENTTFIESEGN